MRRWWWLLLLFLASQLIDCGGNAVNDPDVADPGDASGGVSGAGSGGAAGESGSAGSAGNAGNAGRGGSAGSAGRGGAGGAGTGGSGTGGTGNDWGACSMNSECMVRPRSCCGDCGAATPNDVIAIHRANAGGYTLALCRNTGCPACYSPPDPMLQARCTDGSCEVLDLRTLPLTACRSDQDCRLRTSGCCECGGNVALEALIAIRSDAVEEYERLVCDSDPTCAECVPHYPELARAHCFGGRCAVTGTAGTTPPPP